MIKFSKNDDISIENNDSISTTAMTFVVFIAKLEIDLLKAIEFKQFGTSSFISFILRQKCVQGKACDKFTDYYGINGHQKIYKKKQNLLAIVPKVRLEFVRHGFYF